MMANNQTIRQRQQEQKEKIIEILGQQPIIEIACKKVGIGRTTYYRWLKEDENFKTAAEEAATNGLNLINDMAESQLIAAVRDRNLSAIIFWLKHRHQNYRNRLEIEARVNTIHELPPEQQALVNEALRLANLDAYDDQESSVPDSA